MDLVGKILSFFSRPDNIKDINRRKFLKVFGASSIIATIISACGKDPIGPVIEKGYNLTKINHPTDYPGYLMPNQSFSFEHSGNIDETTVIPANIFAQYVSGQVITATPNLNNRIINLPLSNLDRGKSLKINYQNVKGTNGKIINTSKVDLNTIYNVLPATKLIDVSNSGNLNNMKFQITSSYDLNASTINQNVVYLLEKGTTNKITGNVSYNNKKIELNVQNLKASTDYNVVVKGSVQDIWNDYIDGNEGGDFVHSFRTSAAPDTTPPELQSVMPLDGAVGVNIDTIIEATFSEALQDPKSNFQLFNGSTKVNGNVEYNASTSKLKITPSSNLDYDTQYTVKLLSGIKDLAGNPFNNNQEYNWTFKTRIDPLDAIPDPVGNFSARLSGGNIILSWTIPADKNPAGENDSPNLNYKIYQSNQPIINDLSNAQLVKEVKPGKNENDSHSEEISVDPGKRYYFGIKAIDDQGNESELRTTDILSQGYIVTGKLKDALTDENYAGTKIMQGGNTFFTDNDGNFKFDISSLEDSITFQGTSTQGDSGVIDTVIPYKINGDSGDFGTLYTVDKSYDLGMFIHLLNKKYSETDPNSHTYITQWDPNVAVNGIIPLKLLNVYDEQTTRDRINAVNAWLYIASKGKLQLQSYDDAIKDSKDVTNQDQETDFFKEHYEGNFKGLTWFHTKYTRAGASSNPKPDKAPATTGDPHKPHLGYRARALNRFTLVSGDVHEELGSAIMQIDGETKDRRFDDSVYEGGGGARPLKTKIPYRNIDKGAESYIFNLKISLPISSKVTPNKIEYYKQEF